jgi:hypothetical protein
MPYGRTTSPGSIAVRRQFPLVAPLVYPVKGFELLRFLERQHYRASLQAVQVISPLLHHLMAFGQVGSAVIGASVGVSNGMGELVFDKINAYPQHFIKDRPSDCPKAVGGHFLF